MKSEIKPNKLATQPKTISLDEARGKLMTYAYADGVGYVVGLVNEQGIFIPLYIAGNSGDKIGGSLSGWKYTPSEKFTFFEDTLCLTND